LETDIRQRRKSQRQLAGVRKEGERLAHRHLQNVRDTRAPAIGALALDVEYLVTIAAAVAIGTAQIDIREELHLDMLESVAAAGRTAAVAGVEAERASGVLAFLSGGLGGEQRTDRVEGTDVAGRIGAGGPANRILVDHHDIIDQLGPPQPGELAGRLGRLAAILQQRRVKHILHQRGLARAGHSRYADETFERDADVDTFEIVLTRALQLQPPVGSSLRHDLSLGRRSLA